jgi:hypothetical protein
MTPDCVYLPAPDQITSHAIAFARLMFAHAAFEREVRSLQDDITNKPGFGERGRNQWDARNRPSLMVELFKKHKRNDLPATEAIKKILTDAIEPCDHRNHLTHGEWWCFDPQTLSIHVRSGRRQKNDQENPPEQREYKASDVEALVGRFKEMEAELFKLRRSLKPLTRSEEAKIEKLRTR